MFWVIVAIVIACVFTIYKKPTKLGLDLVGGSRIMLEAKTCLLYTSDAADDSATV